MIEWLLTHYYVFAIIPIAVFALAIKVLIFYHKRFPNPTLLQSFIAIVKLLSLVCVMMAWLISASNVKQEYVHDSDWKTVYSQGGDVCVLLTFNAHHGFARQFTASSCSPLENSYSHFKALSSDSNAHGSIALETVAIKLGSDSRKDTRSVNLSGKNIIIEGDLNENSRITKIEYIHTSKMKRTLFGHSSEQVNSDVDGDLRITISLGKSLQKSNSLFGD
jgi:hypothetical protein